MNPDAVRVSGDQLLIARGAVFLTTDFELSTADCFYGAKHPGHLRY